MKHLKLSFLFCFYVSVMLVSGQQPYAYKRGSLQLPNADLKSGFLLMPVTKPDSVDFLYFRNDAYDYPVKYYADEIISVDIYGESRRFLSVLLPGDSTMVRRIAELHFDGEYKLLSVLERKGETYYITDNTGRLAKLENTYDPPSAANNFTITYNYEYKTALSSLFGNDIEIQNSIAGLRFRSKDLTKLLQNYHLLRELPYSQYPPPIIKGYAGATGGVTVITSAHPKGDSKEFESLFASVGLSGQIDSYSGPAFLRFGAAAYKGSLFHDVQDKSHIGYIEFLEEDIDVSLVNFNLGIGANLFKIGKFQPYVCVGGGYYIYTQLEKMIVKEILYLPENIVFTSVSEEKSKPAGFSGILFEAGTSYSLSSGSRFQLGVSYNHYIDASKVMKNGTTFSVSYQHKLF